MPQEPSTFMYKKTARRLTTKRRVNVQFSLSLKVNTGMLQEQGSILASVVFDIFINNLEKRLNSKVTEFEDDTKLLMLVKNKNC